MTNQTETLMLIDNRKKSDLSLNDILSKTSYKIVKFDDIQQALTKIFDDPDKYQSILVGKHVEGKQIISLLKHINGASQTKIIPIIIPTDKGTTSELDKWTRAGARYCLPNNASEANIRMFIQAAIRDYKRYSKMASSIRNDDTLIRCMTYSDFKFQHLNESQVLANFLAVALPNPRLAAIGISELFINAIEHGNLQITYKEKSALHSHDNWLQEVERRLALPENAHKYVHVNFKRTDTAITITIKDQGPGFDWKKFQTLDSDRVYDNHGRGIVMAKSLTFQDLQYLGTGNEVKCTIPLIDESL